MTQPTGLEPWTPVEIAATSATERASFRKCRRQWLLTVVHRLQTEEDNLNFWLGDLVHAGLEAYYKAVQGGLPLDDCDDTALASYHDAYEAAVEGIPEIALATYEDLGEMGLAMLEGYVLRERTHPIGDEVVQVEQRLFVPIVDEAGNEIGRLAVRTDLFVRRQGRLTAVDHKTHGHKMGSAALDIDDQLTAEVYAGWQAIGEFPEGAVYNALLKKVPRPPERLKDGKGGVPKLSQRKDAPTTAALYRRALADLGLTEEGYEEILALLDEREANDETPFFYREETFRTPGQMDSFRVNLLYEFRDMVDVAAHPEKAYPNPGFACLTCPVRAVCLAMMDDSDAELLVRTGFTVGEPRY